MSGDGHSDRPEITRRTVLTTMAAGGSSVVVGSGVAGATQSVVSEPAQQYSDPAHLEQVFGDRASALMRELVSDGTLSEDAVMSVEQMAGRTGVGLFGSGQGQPTHIQVNHPHEPLELIHHVEDDRTIALSTQGVTTTGYVYTIDDPSTQIVCEKQGECCSKCTCDSAENPTSLNNKYNIKYCVGGDKKFTTLEKDGCCNTGGTCGIDSC